MAPPKPFVKPGEELRFVERLRRLGKWPLVRDRRKPRDPKRPVLSPYLVLQAAPGDQGARPLANDQQVHYNDSVQILDAAGQSVTLPVAGASYKLRCRVTNLGNLGAFGGIAEFFVVAPPTTVDTLASTSKPLLAAIGYEGFTAKPGETVTITSRHAWQPATALAATMSTIVVHAYDAFNDTIKMRFDARSDRHVGRRDTIPDFGGLWKGVLTGRAVTPGTWNVILDIKQVYQNLTISIYIEQVPVQPTQPKVIGVPATIVGGIVDFVTPGVVPAISSWHMERHGANDLNVAFSYPRDFSADGILHR